MQVRCISCSTIRIAALGELQGEQPFTGNFLANTLQYVAQMIQVTTQQTAMRLAGGQMILALVLGLMIPNLAPAEPAAFDLAGPSIEIEITRGGRTLPASQVPNLAVGDRVWMKADLPALQSPDYLMVAAFLRGATNPPPVDWFFQCKTWTGKCLREGLALTVPEGAEQLMIFLAPHTGGDFKTLISSVRGRPGAFVRTAQDLNQATLDRSRLETYLTAIRSLGDSDPSRLREAAPLLARSLAIKVDEKCLGKITVLQAPCLTQGGEALIVDDGHNASIAQQLTSGPASDLAIEASNTPQLKSGYYGPFIGSIFDIAKIFDSLHTAHYQYFPALTSAHGRQLALTLNAPPSFHDPKSVLVVALPAIGVPQFPPLRAVNPGDALCTKEDQLVLPVEGAPIVFSTAYAHDFELHFLSGDGSILDLPAQVDPTRGGFVVDTATLSSKLHGAAKASLHGRWGFDVFEGPDFQIADGHGQAWSLEARDSAGLIVGRLDTIHLHADNVSCLKELTLVSSTAKQWKLEWKKTNAKEIEVNLPLEEVSAGDMTLMIKQFGAAEPQHLAIHAFSEAGHLERFTLYEGDNEGFLTGNRLDQVETVSFDDGKFSPETLSTIDGRDQLTLLADEGRPFRATRHSEESKATVTLKDGRTVEVKASVDPPRPSVVLLSKTVKLSDAALRSNIHLSGEQELPLRAELTFSLRAQSPPLFTHRDKIEVATTDGASSVVLGVQAGSLTLQSARTAVATLNPERAFGSSAFGPLRFRRIIDGVAGNWRPLATLVRLPDLTGADCPASPEAACTLTGAKLFLLDSVSHDAEFTQSIPVPDGFTDQSLVVPHPTDGRLYIKLRDDPSIVSAALLGVKTLAPAEVQPAGGPEVAPHGAPDEETHELPVVAPVGDTPPMDASKEDTLSNRAPDASPHHE